MHWLSLNLLHLPLVLSLSIHSPNLPHRLPIRYLPGNYVLPAAANETVARRQAPGTIQEGRCGPSFENRTCEATDCCSRYGWCGGSAEYCETMGCQHLFGYCNGTPPAEASEGPVPTETETRRRSTRTASATASGEASTTASEAEATLTEAPSSEPSASEVTASATSAAETSAEETSAEETSTTDAPASEATVSATSEEASAEETSVSEAQTSEVSTATSAESAEPAEPTETSAIPIPEGFTSSVTGTCGNTTTCTGSTHGSCCSFYYWCGDGADYCGDGCRDGFGKCDGEGEEGSEEGGEEEEETPGVPNLTLSTNGMCGNGTTCAGSSYGDCCSFYYWCGSGADFCGQKCRGDFGECD